MLSNIISSHTPIIPDVTNIIIEYIPNLYIYHVSRKEYTWDEYDEFVAISRSIELYLDSEMEILPNGQIIKNGQVFNMNEIYFKWMNKKWDHYDFREGDTITIKLVGEALGGYEDGEIICASYNAG